jgi:hypothetical protein
VDGMSDELRDEIASDVRFALSNICRDYLVRGGGRWTEAVIDAVLALPALQRLVAEAAEAARLRAVVGRVEALATDADMSHPMLGHGVLCERIRRALGGD